MRFREGDIVILHCAHSFSATPRMRQHNGEQFVIARAQNDQYTLCGFKSPYGIPYTVAEDWLEYDNGAYTEQDEALYQKIKKEMES